MPIRDGHTRTVALGVGLDLMMAIETPRDQPDMGCRGVTERHRRAAVLQRPRFLGATLMTWRHTGFDRRQRFGLRRRWFQLGKYRFQRVEPKRKRERIIFKQRPEMGHHRKLLVIGEVGLHDPVI